MVREKIQKGGPDKGMYELLVADELSADVGSNRPHVINATAPHKGSLAEKKTFHDTYKEAVGKNFEVC